MRSARLSALSSTSRPSSKFADALSAPARIHRSKPFAQSVAGLDHIMSRTPSSNWRAAGRTARRGIERIGDDGTQVLLMTIWSIIDT